METGKICPRPFYHCEITPPGDVYMCCPAFCKNYKIGNILQTNLEQIWHGKAAADFRARILAGDYSHCNPQVCSQTGFFTEAEIRSRYFRNDRLKYPGTFVLSYDTECNLACAICRKKVTRNTEADLGKYRRIEEGFLPFLQDCERIYMSGAGDPFGSEYSRGFIRMINARWPHLKFQFLTNGQMLTPHMYFSLDLDNRIDSLQVSIHAARDSTYRRVARSPNFHSLLRNLDFYTELKKEGMIKTIAYNYVVCAANYRDMPAFAALASQHDAFCFFSTYRNQKMEPFAKNYAAQAIYLCNHPQFGDFLEVLRHENLNLPCCRFNGLLRDLRREAKEGDNQRPASTQDRAGNACLPSKTGAKPAGEIAQPTQTAESIFAGLPLKDYQIAHLLWFDSRYGFAGKTVVEMGSDIPLGTARGMLRLGAARVYAVNPLFPEKMAAPDERIVLARKPGESIDLPDGHADIVFGIALLEHVLNLDAFARECLRILKKDGICYLQGNPLWTCAVGHHTWARQLPDTGNSYYFHDASSPWEDWEHLCVTDKEDAAARLRAKGVPERDIPALVHQLLEDTQISRKTPTAIEETFHRIFGPTCEVIRETCGQKTNKYFAEALKTCSREDLLCKDIKVYLDRTPRAHHNYDWLPLVCLGHSPFPAQFLRISGIKRINNLSPCALPFDYASHHHDATIKYLNTDFADFQDGIEYDANLGFWLNRKDHIAYNHDNDCGSGDREKLISRIKGRIDNFHKLTSSDSPCAFIFSAYFLPSPKDIVSKVLNAIKKIRGGRPFLFILLGDNNLSAEAWPREILTITEKFPCQSLDEWWKSESQKSPQGKEFIHNLGLKIRDALKPLAILLLTKTCAT